MRSKISKSFARRFGLSCPIFAILFFASEAIAADSAIPRPEYPQPQSVREHWLNLNGPWQFEFDDADVGLKENWEDGRHAFSRQITVPFPFQAKLSGIGDTSIHHVMWYRRTFKVPDNFKDQRTLLHFGAVDYDARVWVNGAEVGSHRGGHVPFVFDITANLSAGENTITLRAEDTENLEQPRGKQFWEPQAKGIFYTRTSGIWQTVWLEAVGKTYLKSFRLTPRTDSAALDVEVDVAGDPADWEIEYDATLEGNSVAKASAKANNDLPRFTIPIPGPKLWSPETPVLYSLRLRLNARGQALQLDEVKTYFAMRKISCDGGKLLLNNKPYYQRLVLDQGYWPEGILTAPSDDALKYDIEMAKKFGFNGARKHQKVEDPRWLYWADKLGYLVWGEMANAAHNAAFTPAACEMFESEWLEAVARDYNHPCIVAWTPFNETWGLAKVKTQADVQHFVERIYDLTKAADPTRPICDNSGWNHVRTDIADIHDYVEKGEGMKANWAETKQLGYRYPEKRRLAFFVDGLSYSGQPIVMSEYGGIGLKTSQEQVIGSQTKAWSYGTAEADVEAYLKRYRDITESVESINEISGFCYTQLTDVEQEVNGVMTYDRKPKLDPAKLAEINLKRK